LFVLKWESPAVYIWPVVSKSLDEVTHIFGHITTSLDWLRCSLYIYFCSSGTKGFSKETLTTTTNKKKIWYSYGKKVSYTATYWRNSRSRAWKSFVIFSSNRCGLYGPHIVEMVVKFFDALQNFSFMISTTTVMGTSGLSKISFFEIFAFLLKMQKNL